jgi:hypothetical protein
MGLLESEGLRDYRCQRKSDLYKPSLFGSMQSCKIIE